VTHLRATLSPEVDVVSGFFRADPRTIYERALGATTLPELEDVREETFLPSSRSVFFRRTAWEAVGGYPEWLDYCEDLVFDLALKRSGCRFAFARDAIAYFRPRPTLGAFFKQYYLYARGDGKADLWRKRHAIRYATYLTAAALLLRAHPSRWLLALGAMAYTRRPIQRLRVRELPWRQRVEAVALVPLIRFAGDVAKMLGYPVGVAWRLATWTSRSSS
jgi:GT2 family glycosyltransferase